MNREELFQFKDKIIEEVRVPEWNNEIFYVRSLSAAEKADWEASVFVEVINKESKMSSFQAKLERTKTIKAKMVELGTCNKDGSRFFKDGDFKQIGDMNAAPVDRLYNAIARLSAHTKEDQDEIEKNLEAVAPTD